MLTNFVVAPRLWPATATFESPIPLLLILNVSFAVHTEGAHGHGWHDWHA